MKTPKKKKKSGALWELHKNPLQEVSLVSKLSTNWSIYIRCRMDVLPQIMVIETSDLGSDSNSRFQCGKKQQS